MKRKITWIILIIVLITLVWRVLLKSADSSEVANNRGRGMPAIPVEVVPIKHMEMTERSIFSGNIEARSSYIVAPKISGQLKKLYVNIGQRVSKGELLAELDDRILQQEFQRAKANVDMARATARQSAITLEFATTELERKRELHNRSFISQSEFDLAYNQFANAQAQDNIAQASLNSAIAAMNSAELQLSFTKIIAEWNDGAPYRIIGERFTEEGAQLGAGSPVVTLMDISNVLVVIDVIERDYGRIKPGQLSEVRSDSYPEQSFKGKVLRVAPILREATRQARVEVDVPNPQGLLKPGMFARVALNFQSKASVRAVEERAITKLRGKEGVYLVDRESSTVSFIEIQRGINEASYVEISAPEIEGEVVSLGQDMLDDGRRISITGEQEKRGAK